MTYHKRAKKKENADEYSLMDMAAYPYNDVLFRQEKKADEVPTKKEKKRRDKDFNNFNNFF